MHKLRGGKYEKYAENFCKNTRANPAVRGQNSQKTAIIVLENQRNFDKNLRNLINHLLNFVKLLQISEVYGHLILCIPSTFQPGIRLVEGTEGGYLITFTLRIFSSLTIDYVKDFWSDYVYVKTLHYIKMENRIM